MKKVLGILLLAAVLLLGYSCNSAGKKAAREEAERLEKEIKADDSLSLQMEAVRADIDSTSAEVEKLLEEL